MSSKIKLSRIHRVESEPTTIEGDKVTDKYKFTLTFNSIEWNKSEIHVVYLPLITAVYLCQITGAKLVDL